MPGPLKARSRRPSRMNRAATAWGCTRKSCQAARPFWAAAVGLSSAVVASIGVTRKTWKPLPLKAVVVSPAWKLS